MNLPSPELPNPLTLIAVAPGDRWRQINSMRAGARPRTVEERESFKPYGEALALNHCSLLKELCYGEWSDTHRLACIRLFREAAHNRSVPMAIAALVMMQAHQDEQKQKVWDWLDESDQKTLIFLFNLADRDPDFDRILIHEQPEKEEAPDQEIDPEEADIIALLNEFQ